MVFDKLENAHLYYGLGSRLQKALEWLSTANPVGIASGSRIEIDGEDIYALYFDMDTLPAPESKLEGHHDYADIQCLLEGQERVGYAMAGTVAPISAYTPDIRFYNGTWDTLTLRPGNFYIVWPQDLHAPRVADGAVSRVRRLVVKVRL